MTGHQKMEAIRAWLAVRYKIQKQDVESREVAMFVKHDPDYPALMAALEAAQAAAPELAVCARHEPIDGTRSMQREV